VVKFPWPQDQKLIGKWSQRFSRHEIVSYVFIKRRTTPTAILSANFVHSEALWDRRSSIGFYPSMPFEMNTSFYPQSGILDNFDGNIWHRRNNQNLKERVYRLWRMKTSYLFRLLLLWNRKKHCKLLPAEKRYEVFILHRRYSTLWFNAISNQRS